MADRGPFWSTICGQKTATTPATFEVEQHFIKSSPIAHHVAAVRLSIIRCHKVPGVCRNVLNAWYSPKDTCRHRSATHSTAWYRPECFRRAYRLEHSLVHPGSWRVSNSPKQHIFTFFAANAADWKGARCSQGLASHAHRGSLSMHAEQINRCRFTELCPAAFQLTVTITDQHFYPVKRSLSGLPAVPTTKCLPAVPKLPELPRAPPGRVSSSTVDCSGADAAWPEQWWKAPSDRLRAQVRRLLGLATRMDV